MRRAPSSTPPPRAHLALALALLASGCAVRAGSYAATASQPSPRTQSATTSQGRASVEQGDLQGLQSGQATQATGLNQGGLYLQTPSPVSPPPTQPRRPTSLSTQGPTNSVPPSPAPSPPSPPGRDLEGWESWLEQNQTALAASLTACRSICTAAANVCTAAREVCRLLGEDLAAPRGARCLRARDACSDAGRRRDEACAVCPPGH